jgi:hypothetical protein
MRLCGHFGERISDPDSEDILFRDLLDRDFGGCLEKTAMDQGVLYDQDVPAETVVVPESALVQESPDFLQYAAL